MDYAPMNLTGHGLLPENVDTISLISNGFHDLGVSPIVGRGLSPSDAPDGQEAQPVAVLSYKFWQKHFFGDRAVLGKTLQLDHKSYVIVGVASGISLHQRKNRRLRNPAIAPTSIIGSIQLERLVSWAGTPGAGFSRRHPQLSAHSLLQNVLDSQRLRVGSLTSLLLFRSVGTVGRGQTSHIYFEQEKQAQ